MDHQVTRRRPVRFGLVGAGPWAQAVHAPAIVAHPDTELVAVWARRPAAAGELADTHGARVADDPAALFASVDAVAFAVPPDVQADLAGAAAQAGRHLVLDKPIGASVAEAERLAGAVGDAGVASLVFLTSRYAPAVTEWITAAAASRWAAGTATWVGGALLSGPYSHSPWRHSRGAVVDIGPHVFDLLEAGLGPVADVVGATRGEHDVWQVLFAHESGARSAATLSIGLPVEPTVIDLSLYGTTGRLPLPESRASSVDCYRNLLDELVGMIDAGRTEHPLDVWRGLRLHRLIERVEGLAVP
ncbi:MAG TPA: Gfo/Idh/MocA family oxidoreductase [Pseudonocardiaceae bacterium]|nr:Gfo/Idh/MocA family oxidoreductase [Pseudonocardiaceae bacterium]